MSNHLHLHRTSVTHDSALSTTIKPSQTCISVELPLSFRRRIAVPFSNPDPPNPRPRVPRTHPDVPTSRRPSPTRHQPRSNRQYCCKLPRRICSLINKCFSSHAHQKQRRSTGSSIGRSPPPRPASSRSGTQIRLCNRSCQSSRRSIRTCFESTTENEKREHSVPIFLIFADTRIASSAHSDSRTSSTIVGSNSCCTDVREYDGSPVYIRRRPSSRSTRGPSGYHPLIRSSTSLVFRLGGYPSPSSCFLLDLLNAFY